MDKFEVSVVIPVYNAAQFLERAVQSALAQPEVCEVVLVEDGSKDDSLSICQRLSQDSRVKLYVHGENVNRGAGATRNLAVKKASYPYVAFLDADDFFLPGRFRKAKEIFARDPSVTGVYEPVSCEYKTEQAKVDFCKMVGIDLSKADEHLSYPLRKLRGKEFFESLILEKNGSLATDGVVVKKSLFDSAGYFAEELRLHQDTHMWIRLAYYGNFSTPEETIPVATRTQHPMNRITARNNKSKIKYYRSLLRWARGVNLEADLQNFILKRLSYFIASDKCHSFPKLVSIGWRAYYLLLKSQILKISLEDIEAL